MEAEESRPQARSSLAMGGTMHQFLHCIRQSLNVALCLQAFPCPDVERHSKPEVEIQTSPELLLEPVLICRSETEQCLIEGSINSARVSIKVNTPGKLQQLLAKRFFGSLCMKAEDFEILRRKPVQGFDLSFLITSEHCMQLGKDNIITFIIHVVESVGSEIEELGKALKARDELSAAALLRQFS